jgi:hypothetical protein
VKREHFQGIALPGDGLSTRGDFQATEPTDWSARPMGSRQPLRIKQSHRAGLSGNYHARFDSVLVDLTGIDSECEGSWFRRSRRYRQSESKH